jgi:hypothetical protein
MTKSLSEIKTLSSDLKAVYSNRDTMQRELERMYLLMPEDMPTGQWVKETIDPDPRNKADGVIRLLTATDPQFSVPYDKNKQGAKEQSSQIENWANQIYQASCRVQRIRLNVDIVRSLVVYGESHVGIYSTAAMLAKSKTDKKRIEAVNKKTPLLFSALKPRSGYPLMDQFGLRAYYREVKMRAADIISQYGKVAEDQLAKYKPTDPLTLSEYWDNETMSVWVENAVLVEPQDHGLPCIPFAVRVAEGSEMFNEADQQTRQPFLYTHWKSHLWERQNLALTVAASMTFAVGTMPLLVLHQNTPDDEVSVDTSGPLNVTIVPPGAKLDTFAKQVIDPSLTQLSSTIDQKVDESTIYGQSLGEPLGNNAPYSMVSLLHQAGRLPLVPYQLAAEEVLADAIQIGLQLLKEEGGSYKGGEKSLTYKSIPDDTEIVCTMDIGLPQDMRENVMIAQQVTASGLASKRWARENFMQIGQSDDMEKEIFQEKMDEFMLQQELQRQLQQQMQQQQSMQAQQMPPEMAQQGMPPEMMGQQSPEMMGGMMQGMPNPQQAQAGLPMTEPMTPQGEMPL